MNMPRRDRATKCRTHSSSSPSFVRHKLWKFANILCRHRCVDSEHARAALSFATTGATRLLFARKLACVCVCVRNTHSLIKEPPQKELWRKKLPNYRRRICVGYPHGCANHPPPDCQPCFSSSKGERRAQPTRANDGRLLHTW